MISWRHIGPNTDGSKSDHAGKRGSNRRFFKPGARQGQIGFGDLIGSHGLIPGA